MAAKPWLTANSLIEAIKRKISFPVSQATFTTQDILAFANEEMAISQIPSVMVYHEEFFVHAVEVPLEADKSRYTIPDRAIGMKMRDLFFKDDQENLYEMTRISSEDKAFWQGGSTATNNLHKYYFEGNDIVLSPSIDGSPSGSLVFYIYLRPNQLVDDERACLVEHFVKTITCDSVVAGDTLTIDDQIFTAVASGAGADEFDVGGTDIITATNLANSIGTNGVATASSNNAVVTIKYSMLDTVIEASDEATLVVAAEQGIEFDQVPSTYLDPVSNETLDLFLDLEYVDFLQTKPGHRTLKYDIQIPTGGISGNIVTFADGDVPDTIIVGDYMCLANECIIPQIPPDLHNGLAERACARILAAIGDQVGAEASQKKIAEIDQVQGTLLAQRSEGSPKKISGRHGLYRYGKKDNF